MQPQSLSTTDRSERIVVVFLLRLRLPTLSEQSISV